MGIGNVTERRMQPPQVGVSVVILTLAPAPSGSRLWLPLVRRTRQPFLGRWALPGGGLRADRSLEESAYYALASTTDLHPRYLEQLYTFGDPARSQGGLPMVSIAYWALVGREETDDLSEAENVRWFPVDALPELAFDHRRIIEYALQRLRARVDQPDVVTTLVGETFTLNQLHGVYEAVAGTSIDLANFRRRMLATGRIEETGERRREGRHRPAAVYRYTPGDPDPVAPYDVVRQRLASLTQSSALNGAASSSPSLDLRMQEALSPLERA